MLTVFSTSAFGQNEDYMDNKFFISANGKEMTATFANNSSAAAFRALIADAPLTVSMSDYGDFEKVGELGHRLPTNDTDITTRPGDVILYLGSSITIYYDVNNWTFTRLGRIDENPTRQSILAVLGQETVNVTFSLKSSSSGLNEVTSGGRHPNVTIEGRTIHVNNVAGNDVVTVSTIQGQTIHSGTDNRIRLNSAGIYLVECNGLKAKVLIQ